MSEEAGALPAFLTCEVKRLEWFVLLHYDTKAGHSGGLPVSKQIDDATDTMSFLMWQLGMLS